jgi:hypothetical protein
VHEPLDIADIVTPAEVADRAATSVEVAAVVIEAHRYGVTSIAAGGAPVLFTSGDVFGPRDHPATVALRNDVTGAMVGDAERTLAESMLDSGVRWPSARFHPVAEWELADMSAALTAARRPDITREITDDVLQAWWDGIDALSDRMIDDCVEITVLWRASWKVLERAFEDWLEAHLHALIAGTDLELVSRQWRTRGRTVADLLCRVTADFEGDLRAGDLVVVENKAVEATLAHLDQLMGYVEHARADADTVVGVLAAPSTTEVVANRGLDLGCLVRTWAELGFLDHHWSPGAASTPIADALASLAVDS